jgi:hypothetical protein
MQNIAKEQSDEMSQDEISPYNILSETFSPLAAFSY